jgi:hypothetical protein
LLGSLYLATHSTKDETSDAAGPATSVVRIDVRPSLGRARRLRDLDFKLPVSILNTVVEDFESEFQPELADSESDSDSDSDSD